MIVKAKNVDAVVIRLRNLFSLDYEGQEMLVDAVVEMVRAGKRVCISSGSALIMERLKQVSRMRMVLREEDFFEKTEDALKALRSV